MPKQPEGENNTGLPSEEPTQKKEKHTGFFSPDVFGIAFEFTKALNTEPWINAWFLCYREAWRAYDKVIDGTSRLPNNDEVLNILDDGHSAFYITLLESKNEGLLKGENPDEAKSKWSNFFDLWTPWFEKHYPVYFLSQAELEERYHSLSEKYIGLISELLKDNSIK